LVGIALVALADFIIPKAQGKVVLPGGDRVRQRFDAGRINGFHLLDQRENAVQFVERFGRLLLVEVKLRQFGQARNIGEGQGHGGVAGRRVRVNDFKNGKQCNAGVFAEESVRTANFSRFCQPIQQGL
jgi:hypothetical protein